MGGVSFPILFVTCPALNVSPPRSALTLSRVLPELSKAVHANMPQTGCLLYFGTGRKTNHCKAKSHFPLIVVILGMLCGTDLELPGCDLYICVILCLIYYNTSTDVVFYYRKETSHLTVIDISALPEIQGLHAFTLFRPAKVLIVEKKTVQ